MSEPVVKQVNYRNKRAQWIKYMGLFLIGLFILVASIWIGLKQLSMPGVNGKESNPQLFSAERASGYLENIAVAPHPIGSSEHDKVQEYLLKELKQFGLKPEIQKESENLAVWGVPYKGQIENIIAVLPGLDSTGTLMITAHYDSEEVSPGAADDGAGVAAILETVRALKQAEPLKNDVVLLISDGEELGLLGAQAFANSHPLAKDIDIVLNFEARGSSGPSVLFETNDNNERMLDAFIESVSQPIAHSFIHELYKYMPNDTDFSIYKPAGVYGLNFAFFDDLYSYHTPDDTIDNLDKRSLQHHGNNMLELTRYFGNMELTVQQDRTVVFFNVAGKKIITYYESMVIPIMLLASTLYIIIVIIGWKQNRFKMVQLGVGFLLSLILFFFSYYVGTFLFYIFSSLKGWDPWLLRVFPTYSNPVFIGTIFISAAILLPFISIFGRKININALTIGASLSWLSLIVITSLFFKGMSYIFVWPFIMWVCGMGLSFIRMKWLERYFKMLYFTLLCLILVFVGPILYLVFLLVTIDQIEVLMIAVSFISIFFFPLLTGLKRVHIVLMSAVFLFIGVIVVGMSYIHFING